MLQGWRVSTADNTAGGRAATPVTTSLADPAIPHILTRKAVCLSPGAIPPENIPGIALVGGNCANFVKSIEIMNFNKSIGWGDGVRAFHY